MATIVTRSGKGSALSFTEGDANFTNLNNDKIELTDLSVSTQQMSTSGGSLSYDSQTGGFTFTPATNYSFNISDGQTSSSVTTGNTVTLSAGTGISVSNNAGTVTISNTASDNNTTYNIGATANMNGAQIQLSGSDFISDYFYINNGTGISLSVANDTITIANNITDVSDLSDVSTATPSDGQVLQWSQTNWVNATLDINDLSDVSTATPSSNDVLKWNGSNWGNGSLSISNLSDVTTSMPSNNQILKWNGSAFVNSNVQIGELGGVYFAQTPSEGNVLKYSSGQWIAGSDNGITSLSQDQTPQLGGSLDGNGNTVSNVNFKDYKETVYALSYSATPSIDAVNGNVQKMTLTGNTTINGLANAETGQSVTVILVQDGTGSRTLSTTMKMAGGDGTLSTDANAIDILTIFYDGTNYYGSLGKAFSTPV